MSARETRVINFTILVVALLVLSAMTFILGNFFGFDETDGFTIWMIHDEIDSPDGIRATISYVGDSLTSVVQRDIVEGDQPPLYYLLLDSWVLAFDESDIMLRTYNILWGMLLLMAAYRLIGETSAKNLIVVLAITPMLYIATIQLTPFVQFLALSLLSIVLYLQWRKSAGLLVSVVYTLVLISLVMTAYSGVAFVLVQAIHIIVLSPHGKFTSRRLIPFIISGLVIFVWIMVFTPAASIGVGWILILIAILGVIAIPVLLQRQNGRREILVVAAFVILIQVASIAALTTRVRYEQAVHELTSMRDLLEPLLYDVPERSIMTYYQRQMAFGGGYTINVGWRDFSQEEIAALVDDLREAPAIWLVYPLESQFTDNITPLLDDVRATEYTATMGDFSVTNFVSPE